MTWGSPLTGHWGFQVAPNGSVKKPNNPLNPAATYKDVNDIQFLWYMN